MVTPGLTTGLARVEVNPTGTEVQLKELAGVNTSGPPRVVLSLRQIALSSPAKASGNGFTVTVTLLVLVHPVAVMVSTTVYVVVTVGLTDGSASVEVYPAGTDVQL